VESPLQQLAEGIDPIGVVHRASSSDQGEVVMQSVLEAAAQTGFAQVPKKSLNTLAQDWQMLNQSLRVNIPSQLLMFV